MALLLATACAVACAVGGVGQGFEVSRSCLLVQRYRGGFDFGGTLTDGTAETPDDAPSPGAGAILYLASARDAWPLVVAKHEPSDRS